MRDLSAYQDLMTAMAVRRADQSAADDEQIVLAALAKHAHELAETLLGDEKAGVAVYRPGLMWAAEVIDPQADEESST